MWDFYNVALKEKNDIFSPHFKNTIRWIIKENIFFKTKNNITIMNKFTRAENRGRELMKSWLEWLEVEEYEFTEDIYSCIDCIFKFKGKTVIGEIKVRDERFREYNTHYMEQKKYDNMLKYMLDNGGDLGLYINFFGDNWCYTYQLHKIKGGVTNTYNIKRTTSGDQTPIPKEIIEIPVDNANIYYRENIKSKWRKVK